MTERILKDERDRMSVTDQLTVPREGTHRVLGNTKQDKSLTLNKSPKVPCG